MPGFTEGYIAPQDRIYKDTFIDDETDLDDVLEDEIENREETVYSAPVTEQSDNDVTIEVKVVPKKPLLLSLQKEVVEQRKRLKLQLFRRN